MKNKDLLTLMELTKADFKALLTLALDLKEHPENYQEHLKGKVLAMIFEKNSTRTRVSFEAGMLQLGGQSIFLESNTTQLSRGEPVKDTAKVLSGYVDGIMIRTYQDSMVQELAKEASIPVINGLTDDHHPCQILADFLTIYECFGTLEKIKIAYIGDGNNIAHSLLIGSSIVGSHLTIATPPNYEPNPEYVTWAEKNGGQVQITNDPFEAVQDADVIITDVWSSMGDEAEQVERCEAFAEYQVNAALVENAHEDFIFLHCLPAHREEEVTTEIIDGAHSKIYQEAENRLHAQKALLISLLA